MREQNTSIVPVIQNLDKIISPILSLVKFDCALMLKRPEIGSQTIVLLFSLYFLLADTNFQKSQSKQ